MATLRLRYRRKILLVRNQHPRNRCRRQGRDRARDKRANSNSCNISTAAWRDLAQDTDLGTERADIGEAA